MPGRLVAVSVLPEMWFRRAAIGSVKLWLTRAVRRSEPARNGARPQDELQAHRHDGGQQSCMERAGTQTHLRIASRGSRQHCKRIVSETAGYCNQGLRQGVVARIDVTRCVALQGRRAKAPGIRCNICGTILHQRI